MTLVGEQWSSRAHELRSLLTRNGVPHRLPRRRLAEAGREALGPGRRSPATTRAGRVLCDGSVLIDPTNAELADGLGRANQLDERARLRRGRRRRRAGRPRRRRVRRLGGAATAGRRARGDRRPGGHELADPQLPRLLARHQRRRARAARLPAGVGVRRRVPAHARGDRAAPDGRPARVAHRRRRRGDAPGRSCSRPASPTGALGVPSLEALTGAGVFYGASVAEAQALAGQRACSSSAAATRPARRRCTSPATPRRVTILVAATSLAESMSQYLIQRDRRGGEHRGPPRDRGRRRARRGAPRAAHPPGPRDRRDRGRRRRRPVRPDRRRPAHRVAAATRVERDTWGYVAHRRRPRPPSAWPLDREPLPYETSAAACSPSATSATAR